MIYKAMSLDLHLDHFSSNFCLSSSWWSDKFLGIPLGLPCPPDLSFRGSRLAPRFCIPFANLENGDRTSLALEVVGDAEPVVADFIVFMADSLCDELMDKDKSWSDVDLALAPVESVLLWDWNRLFVI